MVNLLQIFQIVLTFIKDKKGKDVALAKGEYSNLKITTVTDLKIAKSMIEKD
ncbi:cytidylyltransferase [Streptococcus pneumoniae]|nr:cytidylyltransferase [Streptococcus pneumoniae]